ncbi:MAG: N-acetylmuramoyl-L-alanine amidase family protein [Roseburia sp.]
MEERDFLEEELRKKRARIAERRRRQRRRRMQQRLIYVCALGLCFFCVIFGVVKLVQYVGSRGMQEALAESQEQKVVLDPPDYQVDLLSINDYSRPGLAIDEVNGIVIHYTANPGTTALQNRNYFEGLKDSHETYASSHFIIGLEGEIVQCIPCNEIAYASNDRNGDTISIECCISDDSGIFNDETYATLVHLTAWLIGRYDLTTEDVIRHYDITGKACPKYYVEHEDAWFQFKDDVNQYINENGVLEESLAK